MTGHSLNGCRRNCYSWEATHLRDRRRGVPAPRPSCVMDDLDDDTAGVKQPKLALFACYRSFLGRQPVRHKYGSAMEWSRRQSSHSGVTPSHSSLLLQRLQGALLDAARLTEPDPQHGTAPGPLPASPISPTSSSSSMDNPDSSPRWGVRQPSTSSAGLSSPPSSPGLPPAASPSAASWAPRRSLCSASPPIPPAATPVGMRTPAQPAPATDATAQPSPCSGAATPVDSATPPPAAITAVTVLAGAVQHKYRGVLDAFQYTALKGYRFPVDSDYTPCDDDEVWQTGPPHRSATAPVPAPLSASATGCRHTSGGSHHSSRARTDFSFNLPACVSRRR